MEVISEVVVLITLCVSLTASQQGGEILYPTAHLIPADVLAVNGSQENVGCTGTQPIHLVCLDLDPGTPGGATSYLVDRNIPTSLDFSDDNWAREVTTLNHNGNDFVITFNFINVRATRVELVFFNCPDWGIAAVDISVTTIVLENTEVGNITLQNTSCDSLLTVCIPLQPPTPIGVTVDSYTLNFVMLQNIAWTHIAEVTFYDDSIECADPFLVTAAPTEPTDLPPTSAAISTVVPPTSTPAISTVVPPTSTPAISTVVSPTSTPAISTVVSPTSTPAISTGVPPASTPAISTGVPPTSTPPISTGVFPTSAAAISTPAITSTGVFPISITVSTAVPPSLTLAISTDISPTSTVVSTATQTTTSTPTASGVSPTSTVAISTDTQTTTPTATSSTTDPSGVGTGAQNTTIIVVVIVVVITVLIVISLTIVLCVCLAMRKRKHGIHEMETIHSLVLENKNIELSALKQAQEDTNITYGYADVAMISDHTWSGAKSHEVNSNEPVPVYSTVAENEHNTHKAKEEGTYATVQDDGYAVIDDLQVYFGTKTASKDLSSKGRQSQLAQLSKPISGEMFFNPLYATFNKEATPAPREVSPESAEADGCVQILKPGESSVTDNVYAELKENDGHILTQQVIHEEAPAAYCEPIKSSQFTQKHVISEATEDDLRPYGPIYTVPTAPAENMPIEVTSKNIKFNRELGDGNFGKVILARTVGLSSKDLKFGNSEDKENASFLVAVKTLRPSASTANRSAFEKEYKFMSRLDHSNVIRILGICTSGDTPFVIMEYMEKGDLNQYLQEYTEIVNSSNTLSDGQISTSTLLSMCIQIASAMQYLAARNFVHRDLATRNCLVSDNNVIKIADFGMSRNLYDSHYYVVRGHAALPVRWMATECFYGLFSAKTDVWAFGVTMWEIFTLAKDEPYGDVTDQEIVQDAIKGEERTILEKPEACPQDVYDVMLRCWVHNSTDRATFEEAFVNLSAVNSQ